MLPDYHTLPPWARFVLYVGACAGHATVLMFAANWWSGWPLRRKLLSRTRRVLFLAVLLAPVLFWPAFLFHLFPVGGLPAAAGDWRQALFAYGVFCCVVGFGVLPVVTVTRWLWRPPSALVSNHTHTRDLAAELGYKPIGRGKHRHLARLPFNEVFRVDFTERTLRLPRLPAACDGLTILHVSDLHLCGTPDKDFYERVMDHCRPWDPDLVAVTGDVVDSDRHHQWIVPVLGRLRWKVAGFAILGNHDYWRDPLLVRRRLRRVGLRVLGNAWERIEVRGEPLVVVGHEGPWFRPAPDLANCPAGVFRLCLSHTPDNIRWARRNAIDLMLSGHNHGGQIRFPVLGSVFVPSRYSRRYDRGTFHEPPTVLHVSRGLAGQHPLRYNCRPEVTKIVLRAGGR
jgi:predicted MPP superfamily phosphohydrolase